MQAELMMYHYPENYSLLQDSKSIKYKVEERLTKCFLMFNDILERQPYLLGDNISISDIYLFMLSRWARTFTTPPSGLKNIGAYLNKMIDRPAFQNVFAKEKLKYPYV